MRGARVTSLPGVDPADVLAANLYSGYLLTDADADTHIFYTLAKSKRNGPSDPLLVWLQGGPGACGATPVLYTWLIGLQCMCVLMGERHSCEARKRVHSGLMGVCRLQQFHLWQL